MVQLSSLLSRYFFILHSVVGTSKSCNAGLWLIDRLGFLSRGLVLPCVFGWVSKQLSLLLLVSVNKGGLFSQHPRGLFLISHYHYWFFFLSFPQETTRKCFGVWRSNDLQRISFFNYFSFFLFSPLPNPNITVPLNSYFVHSLFVETGLLIFCYCCNWNAHISISAVSTTQNLTGQDREKQEVRWNIKAFYFHNGLEYALPESGESRYHGNRF